MKIKGNLGKVLGLSHVTYVSNNFTSILSSLYEEPHMLLNYLDSLREKNIAIDAQQQIPYSAKCTRRREHLNTQRGMYIQV